MPVYKWIPINKRKPKAGQDVLVANLLGVPGCPTISDGHYYSKGGKGGKGRWSYVGFEIDYWMPTPGIETGVDERGIHWVRYLIEGRD